MAEMMNDIEVRKAYCNTLIELAKEDDKVVVLEADLMKASGTMPFKQEFPERGIDVGVAEADMVGVAAGLSLKGYKPFAASFGTFASRRAFDQFFLSANYAKLNVKLVGTDPGVTAAYNGGTHMPFEDIGIMANVPDLVIVEPSDAVSAAGLTKALYYHRGSGYMRLHRKKTMPLYKDNEIFDLGKSKVIKRGSDVTIAALGAVMVNEAVKAADIMKKDGITATVIDTLCVKPLDTKVFLAEARRTRAFVTCENHQVSTGLGSIVAQLFMKEGVSVPFGTIGIHDRFGQVGTVNFLMKEYGLRAEDIIKKVRELLKVK